MTLLKILLNESPVLNRGINSANFKFMKTGFAFTSKTAKSINAIVFSTNFFLLAFIYILMLFLIPNFEENLKLRIVCKKLEIFSNSNLCISNYGEYCLQTQGDSHRHSFRSNWHNGSLSYHIDGHFPRIHLSIWLKIWWKSFI